MTESEFIYISDCFEAEVIYGTSIEFDEGFAYGICSACHAYEQFSPIIEEVNHIITVQDTVEHDCDFVSMCCGARPFGELDYYLSGLCGQCRDGTGFECEVEETCDNNTDTLLNRAWK